MSSGFADKWRGSRHQRGYGTAWDKLRKTILTRDGGLCQVHLRRGLVVPGNIVDHIRNKADGGTDDPANLQAICADCHAAKTADESAAARGATRKPSAAASSAGLPTDPAHPWNTAPTR